MLLNFPPYWASSHLSLIWGPFGYQNSHLRWAWFALSIILLYTPTFVTKIPSSRCGTSVLPHPLKKASKISLRRIYIMREGACFPASPRASPSAPDKEEQHSKSLILPVLGTLLPAAEPVRTSKGSPQAKAQGGPGQATSRPTDSA